jgi:glycosidase
MTRLAIDPIKFFDGQLGFLFPYDVRYKQDDRAFCNPLPDGRVQFRLHTELDFTEAHLVYHDDRVRSAAMQLYARDSRFLFWEGIIQPARPHIRYSFALRRRDGAPVYRSRFGFDHAVEPPAPWHLQLDQVEPFVTPAWMHGAVVYQIFPERFANGDPRNDPPGAAAWGTSPLATRFLGGDLQGITAHVDYLRDLGVDVVYLTPINTSPSSHKYDAEDYYHVDPAFGGEDALHALVDALHQRDIRIILDASFNHCHPRFFAFQDLIRNGANSRYRDWFTISEYPVRIRYRPHLIPSGRPHDDRYAAYLEHMVQTSGVPFEIRDDDGPIVEPTYLAWYSVLNMPKLNQRNPETRAYFLDVAQYWLREFHIDGWRMDVAQHIDSDFWIDLRKTVKAVDPNCFLLAEIWGDTTHWLQGDQFDSTMNYIFRDLCLAYFARATLDAAAFIDGVTRMLSLYAPQVMAVTHNLLSSHDAARFRFVAGERSERFKLATLFQLTMPGAPGIYYGDEIGMTGGEDPDNRRAFPWHEPDTWDRDMLEMMRDLIRLRHTYPALRYGAWRSVWIGAQAFAYQRDHEDQHVLIVINRGEVIEHLSLPGASENPQLLWGKAQVSASNGQITIERLPAWDGAVILLARNRAG